MSRYPAVMLASCVVPWDERNRFVESLFRRQVKFLAKTLTRHLYIFGTAGEGYAVGEEDFRSIASAFLDECAKEDAEPMVGLIGLSLSQMVSRLEWARELGCRRFQISFPSWGRLNDREIDLFFGELCGSFPDCQFLHYNLPRAGRVLHAEDYARVSGAHPNLVAVKYSTPDGGELDACCRAAPRIQFFPTEIGYLAVRPKHLCGMVVSVSGTRPALAKKLFEEGEDLTKAAGWMDEVEALRKALLGAVGADAHMDGAYDKMIYKLHDPEFPLRLLPPYASAAEEAFLQFREKLPPFWRDYERTV